MQHWPEVYSQEFEIPAFSGQCKRKRSVNARPSINFQRHFRRKRISPSFRPGVSLFPSPHLLPSNERWGSLQGGEKWYTWRKAGGRLVSDGQCVLINRGLCVGKNKVISRAGLSRTNRAKTLRKNCIRMGFWFLGERKIIFVCKGKNHQNREPGVIFSCQMRLFSRFDPFGL